jgi:hypothetical protein
MPNLTSIAEWAKLVGISRQSAYDAIERCGIPVTDKKVDPDYATHLYEKNTRKRTKGEGTAPLADGAQPSTPAGAGGAGGAEAKEKVPGYEVSRARREAAEAQLAEVKLAELAGKFLLKSDVEDSVFEIGRALRDGLNNCARRIAAEVAACTSAEACEAAIEREHTALLESMAHAFRSQLGLGQAEGAE